MAVVMPVAAASSYLEKLLACVGKLLACVEKLLAYVGILLACVEKLLACAVRLKILFDSFLDLHPGLP